ncbi:MAG: hypothetical protein LC751_10095, partial [Actinobacteria bacterium]|nr:hypothetical protein [Actinomycetota bacterium]
AYVAALREAFLPDLSVGERVGSPFGNGEVRYLSGDGRSAVVRLDGVSGRELWLSSVQLFRLDVENEPSGACEYPERRAS